MSIMKDYDHQIVWLDYLTKNLSRKKGSKVSKNIRFMIYNARDNGHQKLRIRFFGEDTIIKRGIQEGPL